jgi:hypothetical protein
MVSIFSAAGRSLDKSISKDPDGLEAVRRPVAIARAFAVL